MSPANRQRGFTFLMVLFFVAITGAGLTVISNVWVTHMQHERESALLFAGSAYREAIARYHEATPGPVKQYPVKLEQLLKDPRFPDTRRYLRQLYPDPVTGKDWVLVTAPQGGIMGVASASENAPLKRAGFRDSNRVFEYQADRLKDKLRYRDWEFVYDPVLRRAVGGSEGRVP